MAVNEYFRLDSNGRWKKLGRYYRPTTLPRLGRDLCPRLSLAASGLGSLLGF